MGEESAPLPLRFKGNPTPRFQGRAVFIFDVALVTWEYVNQHTELVFEQ